MVTRTVTVRNTLGMHARAAAQFVRAASPYAARVSVARGNRVVDGKSILGVLLLAAASGTTITITADGPDEADVLESLCGLVDGGFGEGPCTA